MGASSSNSINKYSNDFELVIRASKELEQLLEAEFHAPSGKNVGLHEKIGEASHNGHKLPPNLVKSLRYIVTIRNKLVHEKDFNTIPERNNFVTTFDEAENSLKKMMQEKNGNSKCIIS